MNSDLRKGKRELLKEFIRTYQSQPCLWRIKSEEYHDKAKKEAAYNLLLEKYKLIDPNADRDTVVKKINSFRTNYSREKKKIEESRRSGSGTDEINESKLWYVIFDLLDRSSSILNEREEEVGEQPSENSVGDLEESVRESEPTHSAAYETSCSSEEIPIQSTAKKIPPKRSNEKCDALIEMIEQHFKKPESKDDKYDVFGKNVALRMRDITNNTQRLLAEKIINEALFMAEMAHLTMSHSICINPIDKTSSMCVPQSQHSNYNNQTTRTYYELSPLSASPTSSADDNSNHSLASFISNYSDI